MTRLDALRAAIDAVDARIVADLAERDALVAEVWAIKAEAGVPSTDTAREADLYAAVRARAEAHGLDPDAVEQVFRVFVGRRLGRSVRPARLR